MTSFSTTPSTTGPLAVVLMRPSESQSNVMGSRFKGLSYWSLNPRRDAWPPRERCRAATRRAGAELTDRHRDHFQTRRLPLVLEGLSVDPPRAAQRGHEQIHLTRIPALYSDLALAEVDLNLATRRHLGPNGRQRLRRYPIGASRHGQ